MKAIEIKKNKKGQRVALCDSSVWVEKENYYRGRNIKQWAYIVKGVTLEEAKKTFNRRVK